MSENVKTVIADATGDKVFCQFCVYDRHGYPVAVYCLKRETEAAKHAAEIGGYYRRAKLRGTVKFS